MGETGDFVFESNAGFEPALTAYLGDPGGRAEPDEEAARKIGMHLQADIAEVRRFLRHFFLRHEPLPSRSHIDAVAAQDLAVVMEQLGLDPDGARRCLAGHRRRSPGPRGRGCTGRRRRPTGRDGGRPSHAEPYRVDRRAGGHGRTDRPFACAEGYPDLIMDIEARPMAIEARGLVKVFHVARRAKGLVGTLRSLVAPQMVATTAVDGVSFSVSHGELLALLGPNGAGKSTTIKMLTGIVTPTSGEAVVAGVVPYRERERSARNVGAVFGQRTQLWWDLPARESFRILRDIYDIGRVEHEARLREFDSLLELSSFWDTRVRHLSLGQRVRCDLAAALLHDPPVVFLDEPTIGMDVVVKEQVRALLRHQVEQRGRTVLLTTHDMTEVERLAERVVLINYGRIVMDGNVAGIRERFGGGWRVVATIQGYSGAADTGPCPPGLVVKDRDGDAVVFAAAGQGEVGRNGTTVLTPHQAIKLIIERYEVTDIRVQGSDLEDVMRAAYTGMHDTQREDGELVT